MKRIWIYGLFSILIILGTINTYAEESHHQVQRFRKRAIFENGITLQATDVDSGDIGGGGGDNSNILYRAINGLGATYTSPTTITIEPGVGYCSNKWFKLTAQSVYTVTNIPGTTHCQPIYVFVDYSALPTVTFYNTTNHPVENLSFGQVLLGSDRMITVCVPSNDAAICPSTMFPLEGRTYNFQFFNQTAQDTALADSWINFNSNPDGTWQTPEVDTDLVLPVGVYEAEGHVDHKDSGAHAQIGFGAKELTDHYGGAGSFDWRSGPFHLWAQSGYNLYETWNCYIGPSRKMEIMGDDADDNIMRIKISGWRGRR